MQAREVEPPVAEPQLAPTALVGEGAAEAPLAETIPQLREILAPVEEAARSMLEAEEAGTAWWHARRKAVPAEPVDPPAALA
jgi:hypothetical protein